MELCVCGWHLFSKWQQNGDKNSSKEHFSTSNTSREWIQCITYWNEISLDKDTHTHTMIQKSKLLAHYSSVMEFYSFDYFFSHHLMSLSLLLFLSSISDGKIGAFHAIH